MMIYYANKSFWIRKYLYCFFVLYFLLSFLEKVGNNIGDIFSMVSNFGILCSFNSDKGCIIYSWNLSENLSLSWAWFARNKNVRWPHCLSKIFVFNLPHSIFVSNCQRNCLFGKLLWNDVIIQNIYEHTRSHVYLISSC